MFLGLSGGQRNPLFSVGDFTAKYFTRSKAANSNSSSALTTEVEKTPCNDCLAVDLHKLDAHSGASILLKRRFSALQRSAETCDLCDLMREELIQRGVSPSPTRPLELGEGG